MGLEVYYPTDIKNAIRAAEQAASAGGANAEFMSGYRSALTTIALALGVADEIRQLPAGSRTISDAKGS